MQPDSSALLTRRLLLPGAVAARDMGRLSSADSRARTIAPCGSCVIPSRSEESRFSAHLHGVGRDSSFVGMTRIEIGALAYVRTAECAWSRIEPAPRRGEGLEGGDTSGTEQAGPQPLCQDRRGKRNGRGGRATAGPASLWLNHEPAEATGFEPAISALTGLHVRPLHHASSSGQDTSPGVSVSKPNIGYQLSAIGSWRLGRESLLTLRGWLTNRPPRRLDND